MYQPVWQDALIKSFFLEGFNSNTACCTHIQFSDMGWIWLRTLCWLYLYSVTTRITSTLAVIIISVAFASFHFKVFGLDTKTKASRLITRPITLLCFWRNRVKRLNTGKISRHGGQPYVCKNNLRREIRHCQPITVHCRTGYHPISGINSIVNGGWTIWLTIWYRAFLLFAVICPAYITLRNLLRHSQDSNLCVIGLTSYGFNLYGSVLLDLSHKINNTLLKIVMVYKTKNSHNYYLYLCFFCWIQYSSSLFQH